MFGRWVRKETLTLVIEAMEARCARAEREADHWRAMAESLRADLAEVRRRELPPIPGPEESAVGSIHDGDAEYAPTAVAARAKRA